MRYRILTLSLLQWISIVSFLTFPLWGWGIVFALLVLLISFFTRELMASLCVSIFLLSALLGAQLHIDSLEHNKIHLWANSQEFISYQCTLRTDPHQLPSKVKYGKVTPGNYTALCELLNVSFKNKYEVEHLPVRIVSHFPIEQSVGESVEGFGELFTTAEVDVAAQIYSRNSLSLISPGNSFTSWVNEFRVRFSRLCGRIHGDVGALIPGLIDGDTSRESGVFLISMQRSGLTHLTAVSGENFTIVVVAILWLLTRTLPFYRLRYAIVAASCLLFIFIARPSPSVMRAAIMIAFYLWGKIKGYQIDPVPTLGLAILLLISSNPFEALDPGFALSSLATLGILLIFPRVDSWSQRHHLRRKMLHKYLSSPLLLAITANLFTAPIAVSLSGYFSWSSIPSNVIIEPLVAPVTIFGALSALFTLISPAISYLFLLCCYPFTWSIVEIAHFFGKLPTWG